MCYFEHAKVVHHIAYDMATLTGNDLSRLIGVCHDCHQKSEFAGRRKRSLKEANEAMRELQEGYSHYKEAHKKGSSAKSVEGFRVPR